MYLFCATGLIFPAAVAFVKRYPHTIHAANFVGAKGKEARWGTATRSKEFLHMTKGTHTDMKARMGALKQSKSV